MLNAEQKPKFQAMREQMRRRTLYPTAYLDADSNPSALRGMLAYNALIALYLAYLGGLEHMAGTLLWPAVALHAAVTLLLLRAWRNGRCSIPSPCRGHALPD